MQGPPIERASAIDLMELASATTPAAGQVGAVLVLGPGGPTDPATVGRSLEERTRAVPRLRQRLQATPPGCGRPVWVDDPDFAIADHVRTVACQPSGDLGAVLDVAADAVARPLPPDRPRWSATVVTGLAGGRSALVLVFHHVLTDGMGGLAVLAHLVDGTGTPGPSPLPRPAPPSRALWAEAWRARREALGRLPAGFRLLPSAVAELVGERTRSPATALLAPVGSDRCLGVARTALAPVRAAARAHGATVNDAALVVVAGALGELARRRGEALDPVVASVPVSTRSAATAAELGNDIGIMAVPLPTVGSPEDRLASVAAATRTRKQARRGTSAVLLTPAFRLLGAVGALRWATEHQRAVTTFVTNLRGPDERLRFLGTDVEQLLPVSSTSGNVRLAFAVFSYAGDLTVTVVADESLAAVVPEVVDALEAQLGSLRP